MAAILDKDTEDTFTERAAINTHAGEVYGTGVTLTDTLGLGD